MTAICAQAAIRTSSPGMFRKHLRARVVRKKRRVRTVPAPPKERSSLCSSSGAQRPHRGEIIGDLIDSPVSAPNCWSPLRPVLSCAAAAKAPSRAAAAKSDPVFRWMMLW